MTDGGAMSYREEILALASELTGDYVPYYPRLAKLVGSVKAAVLLSRLVAWTGHFQRGGDPRHRDGWLWKTSEALRQETGLSRHEQDGARARLKALGLLEEQLRGLPAQLHYRVNLDRLGTLLGQQIGKPYQTWRWDDRPFLDGFLGRHRVVYRRLALACDSLTASIHLSTLLLTVRKQLLSDDDVSRGWDAWITLDVRMPGVMGINPRGLARARRRLVELGVIEERRERKLNPRVQTRLLPGPLMALVKPHHPLSWASKTACHSESVSPDVRIDELLNDQNRQTGKAKTGKLELPESANCVDQNRQTGLPETATVPIALEAAQTLGLSASLACARQDFPGNTPLLPPQPPQEIRAAACGGREGEFGQGQEPVEPQAPPGLQGGGLIYPGQMLQTEQALAQRLMERVPVEQRQLVLDELAGQLTAKGLEGVRNPLGYLTRLAQRAAEGQFIPTLALGVAKRREALREETERRRAENQARRQAKFDRQASRAKLAEVMAAAGLR